MSERRLCCEQKQTLNVIHDIRELCDAWNDYRYHKREMNRAWTRVRHICRAHSVNLRAPIYLTVLLLLLVGCKSPKGAVITPLPKAALVAPTVTLEWDYSPDASATSYRIKSGVSSGVYTNSINVGKTNRATVPVVPGVLNYFAATALNDLGMESVPSNEVSYMLPAPRTNYLDVIYQLSADRISGPWTRINTNTYSFTNSQQFYRLEIERIP